MGMYSLMNSTGGGSKGKPPRTEEDERDEARLKPEGKRGWGLVGTH